MTDQEIINNIEGVLWENDYYQELRDDEYDYRLKVLVRYTRWLERARAQKEIGEYLEMLESRCCFGVQMTTDCYEQSKKEAIDLLLKGQF